jgi:hypothetical protein
MKMLLREKIEGHVLREAMTKNNIFADNKNPQLEQLSWGF